MKTVWKEQKLKPLEPPENAATVESIFAPIITSIFISELIQVNEGSTFQGGEGNLLSPLG